MANNSTSEMRASNFGLGAPNQGIVTAVVNAASSGTLTLDKPATWVQCLILQKFFTAGNGSVAPIYSLEADSDGNFTFGNYGVVDKQSTQRATGPASCMLIGAKANGPTKYWRVVQTMSGTDTAVYEYKLTAIA